MSVPAFFFPPQDYVLPVAQDGEGERLLLASVIRRAAFDIALYRNAPRLVERRIGVGAYNWMFRDPNNHFMAFENICDLLNEDPEWIRQNTLRLRRADVVKIGRIC